MPNSTSPDANRELPADEDRSRRRDPVGDFLTSLVLTEARPYRARARFAQVCVRELLRSVGDPHRGLRTLHIAGSKGKGSTALFSEAILRASGLRTGTFTSPHLERWTERFRLDGREATENELLDVLDTLRPHVDRLRRRQPDNPPTFFDTATAAALLLFRRSGVDIAIVEAGIGGRLDSTTIVDPTVTCITSVELEHTDKLGGSLTAISREKAGIIKPGKPLVTGTLPAAARRVIAKRVDELGAHVMSLGEGLRLVARRPAPRGQYLTLRADDLEISTWIRSPGRHLAVDAALAFGCAKSLAATQPEELARAARSGLRVAELPGRIELVHERPTVIVDGAHTRASLHALLEVLAEMPGDRLHLVVSASSTEHVGALSEVLIPKADLVTVTRADPSRSLDPHLLAAHFHTAHTTVRIIENPVEAVRIAFADLGSDALLCVTGSVYMAGVARSTLSAITQNVPESLSNRGAATQSPARTTATPYSSAASINHRHR